MDYKLQFCSLRQIGWIHWEKKTRKLFVKNQIFQCLLFYRNLFFHITTGYGKILVRSWY